MTPMTTHARPNGIWIPTTTPTKTGFVEGISIPATVVEALDMEIDRYSHDRLTAVEFVRGASDRQHPSNDIPACDGHPLAIFPLRNRYSVLDPIACVEHDVISSVGPETTSAARLLRWPI